MRRTAAAGRALAALALITGVADAEDGELDLSFGTRGVVTTPGPVDAPYAASMVLQDDGRIVVSATASGFRLERHLQDGSLDATFGSGGIVSTPIPVASYSLAGRIALQPDGRIVAAGGALTPTGRRVVVARYLADGTLDATFGVGGIVTTALTIELIDFALALHDDGRIVVGVTRLGASVGIGDLGVLRYLDDGTPDASLDGDGLLLLDFDVTEATVDVLAQPDGKMVLLSSYAMGCCAVHTRLVRLAADGSLDAGFGSLGVLEIPEMWPRRVMLRPTGDILLAGAAAEGPVPMLAKVTSTGALATGFGDGGLVIAPGLGTGSFHDVVAQADGRLVAAGERRTFEADFLLARYESDGTLDPSFARCGATITSVGTPAGIEFASRDRLTSVAEQADGSILAAGTTSDAGGVTSVALARYGIPPLPPCLTDAPGRSKLVYKTTPRYVESSNQKLVWRWRGSASTSAFGDPMGDTDFRFCVQDGSGAPVIQAKIEAADSLTSQSGWRPTSAGFKFVNGFSDGVSKLALSAPPAGEAQLKLRMRPAFLAPFAMVAQPPFAVPVTTKLVRNDDHGCFEATFSSASKNETTGFRALSD